MSSVKKDSGKSAELLTHILAAPFLSNLTHELRTPLNSINGMTKLSLEACNQPELQEYLSILDESVDQLSGLLNLLIEYFNINTNSIILHPREIELEDFIIDSLKHLFVFARSKKLSISVYFHPDVPRSIQVDPERFKLIVEQLVGNAIKFTPSGKISLDFYYKAEDQVLEFSVKDSGVGIDESFLPRVFEAFEQEGRDYTRHFGGTGLGLTIAQFLSKAMGGTLSVESVKNTGTRVTVRLPLSVCKLSNISEEFSKTDYPRWVVVSSSESLHEFFKKIVSDLGSKFTYVDGRIANELGSKETSVIFLDYSLPISDELRGFISEAHGHGVRVSGYTPPGRIDTLGAELPHLESPITPRKLLECLSFASNSKVTTPKSVQTGLSGVRILVIEDDAINLLTVVRLLEKKGAIVYQASHVVKGLELLTEYRPDLALVDIGLPTISGFEFMRTVFQGEAKGISPSFPVLALTAYSSQEDRSRMKKAGFRDILVKPYNPERLNEAIIRVIDAEEKVSPAPRGTKESLLHLVDSMDFRGLESQISEVLKVLPGNTKKKNEWFKLLLIGRREDISGLKILIEKMEREGHL